ncbi:NAD(P)/FAD-dependent oxidoreductase [Brucella intermedia]|uniref:NAD(P)/FAD-dependent oxidoreductase n=1 Tax=Brucella intermedia TaxID=94625 RepID=UPI00178C4465|nr:FAD-dependent monooxygenase [Brucella intermedia]
MIGGGTAGSAAAFTLAKAGLHVLVVDRLSNRPAYRIGESLPGQAIHLLKRKGLFEWVRNSHPLENPGDLSVWGSTELVSNDFVFSPYGNGWHVDRVAFDNWLQQAAKAAGAVFFSGSVRRITRTALDLWTVHLAPASFRTRWLVDASGRHGFLSRCLGIKRIKDSPLLAVYSWGQNRSSESRTVVEAVPEGWWYTAALPGGQRVAAMQTSPEHARFLLRSPAMFAEAMQNTLHLKRYCSFDQTWTRPRGSDAGGSVLTATGGRGWMAIGDAAITFDPLSSHGILNALAHGIFGAEAITKALDGFYGEYNSLLGEILIKRDKYKIDLTSLYAAENRWNNTFWKRKSNESD